MSAQVLFIRHHCLFVFIDEQKMFTQPGICMYQLYFHMYVNNIFS